ncbi:MAG: hypothetical protein R3F54_19570 [Alphaproteobacteria bacterium]
MRVLLFSLLIGLGLVMHQAGADPVDGADATWQADMPEHDCSGDHDGAAPGSSMDCGLHATCCPAMAPVADEVLREPLAFTHLFGPPADYSSPSSPPAAPPPRS